MSVRARDLGEACRI